MGFFFFFSFSWEMLMVCLSGIGVQVENHGIEEEVLEKVKLLVNRHYDENMKEKFYNSDVAKNLGKMAVSDVDWESTFFIWHKPNSNISQFTNVSQDLW